MKTVPLFIGDEKGLRSWVPDLKRKPNRPKPVFDPEFGRRVKLARVMADLSQVEFSKMLGIHQVTLSRIETATGPLSQANRDLIEMAIEILQEEKDD